MSQKMKISAVICELDPLHLGHRLLFSRARENHDGVVAVLSGNFVQRGAPAMLDKWARTRLALENGADLVVELSLPWACAGAERFAAGGAALTDGLGNVDSLFFGSETADLPLLEKTAEALLSDELSRVLAEQPETGDTFARRREAAVERLLGPEAAALLQRPNDILALEYLKALRVSGSAIIPHAVLRQGAGHDRSAGEGEYRSASELRELIRQGKPIDGLVPESTAEAVRREQSLGRCPAEISRLETAILCKLRTMTPEELSTLPDVSEGLENRLYEAVRRAGNLEELYGLVKSRRYTHARIRRLVLHAFLGVTKDLPPLPPAIRILGMNRTGERILKEASPTLPTVSRPAELRRLGGDALRVFEAEARADDLYALACPLPGPCGRDMTEKLIRID